jgi:hypothetical protein
MGASKPEDVETLFGLLGPVTTNPDAGQKTPANLDAGSGCPEACRVAALRSISLGPDDAKAARAIARLTDFARYGADQASARAVLNDLASNPTISDKHNPKRLDALLLALQFAQ